MKKLLLLSSVALIGLAIPHASQAGDSDLTWQKDSYTTVKGDSENAKDNIDTGYNVNVDVDADVDTDREGLSEGRGEEAENAVAKIDVDADLDVDVDIDKVATTPENRADAELVIKEKAY